jgi:rare lipoprotein A (peptidoglycan hydrolase)
MTAIALTTLLAIGTATAAGAHPTVAKWWQYDKETWHHTWKAHPGLQRQYVRWRRQHQEGVAPSNPRAERKHLAKEHLRMHFHRAIGVQYGEASWYDGDGKYGACGKVLHGLYAASRTLPCGSLVSVRLGGRYVIVTILDRGPWNSSERILDLSPKAFAWLAA